MPRSSRPSGPTSPAPSPTVPLCRALEIGIEFGSRPALSGLTFEIHPGTITAVIGPNGSGKTTLLNLLAGLERPSTGELSWQRPHPPVAYLTQRHSTVRWLPLTSAEVIRMGRYRMRGLLRPMSAADRRFCTLVAEELEIGDLLHRQYGNLSGGQQQRVLVAQMLAQEARLILLDEPITGLDLASQSRIIEIVGRQAAAGVAAVLTTHHLDEARDADQVLLLSEGRMVAAGSPGAVLTAANLRSAYGDRVLAPTTGGEITVLDDHGHDHGPPG